MLWPRLSFRIKVGAMSPTLRRRRFRPDDARSRRIVLLSHCLLNQNTRYLGGAVCPGAVSEVIEPYLDAGVGLVQLPCPEQRTWGGVEKRALLWILDHPRASRAAAVLAGPLKAFMRLRYRRIAREAVRNAADSSPGRGGRGRPARTSSTLVCRAPPGSAGRLRGGASRNLDAMLG